MEKHSIIINRMQVVSKRSVKDFANEMLAHPYSDEEGWGYDDVVRKDDILYATLKKRTPIYYSVWNEELQQLERQLIQVMRELAFEMDFGKGFLVAQGTNTQLNVIKQCFRQSFWGELVYESLELVPYDFIYMFSRDGFLSSVKEVTINDFHFEGILLGRYIARMTSPVNISKKLSEYGKSIIRARMVLLSNGEQCELTVNNRNVLSVVCSEGAKSSLVEYLKHSLK